MFAPCSVRLASASPDGTMGVSRLLSASTFTSTLGTVRWITSCCRGRRLVVKSITPSEGAAAVVAEAAGELQWERWEEEEEEAEEREEREEVQVEEEEDEEVLL